MKNENEKFWNEREFKYRGKGIDKMRERNGSCLVSCKFFQNKEETKNGLSAYLGFS